MAPYKYRPLDSSKKEIRILHLLPGNHDDAIRLSMSNIQLQPPTIDPPPLDAKQMKELRASLPPFWEAHQTLEGRTIFYCKEEEEKKYSSWVHPNAPSHDQGSPTATIATPTGMPGFEAASYTWGLTKTVSVVEVMNDEPASTTTSTLDVGENLRTMLIHLRKPEITRSLWVDAICINQEDLVERGQQVKEMRKVYTFSSRVIVWLGESSEDSALALRTLVFIGKQVEFTADNYIIPAPGCAMRDWFEFRRPFDIEPQAWKAIAHLIKRPYFKRLWIVQEIQMANRHSIVQCGGEEISWYHMRRGLLRCAMATTGQHQFSPAESDSLFHVRNISTSLGADDIAALFVLAQGSECTDSRDRVFAILGLLPQSLAQRIVPQYSSTVHEVYMQAFLASVDATQRLSLLELADSHSSAENRPSWLPGLAHHTRVMYPGFASGPSAAQAAFDSPGELHVSGVFCDAVAAVQPAGANDVDAVYQYIQHSQLHAAQSCAYISPEEVTDACSWTASEGYLRDRWASLTHLPGLSDARNLFSRIAGGDSLKLSETHVFWYEQLLADIERKIMFVTTSGRIGCGHNGVQSGDKFYVLLGYAHAVLLRPVQFVTGVNSYKLVGSAYVDGFLEGEALLGSLPEPWRLIFREDEDRLREVFIPIYYNPLTEEETRHDPRLDALPPDWEEIGQEDETRQQIYVQHYRNKTTGGVINSDPRLLPDALKARGVPLETIVLV
jgi:hypothetical protein